MNPRHNEIAPSNTSSINSTRLPSPPSNGGGESGVRGRPSRRSLPPLLPYPQIPLNRPPMGFPTYHPFSFGPQPHMSPAPLWRLPYYPPAPVANYNAPPPPPLPFTRPTTSVGYRGGIPPRNAHRRRNSHNFSGWSSLVRPQSAEPMIGIFSPTTIYPIEMPVGVMPNERPAGENESRGEADGVMNVFLTNYMDQDKIFYVYSADDLEIIFGDSENVKSSGSEINSNLNGHESPNLPPSLGNHHGVIDGNENALSDPKYAKRILPNQESSGQYNAKKVRRVQELEDENKQLRIGANGLQEQLSRRNALNEQLTVEDLRLKLASDEVILDSSGYDMSNWETLDANMFQTFNPSQLDQ